MLFKNYVKGRALPKKITKIDLRVRVHCQKMMSHTNIFSLLIFLQLKFCPLSSYEALGILEQVAIVD